VIRSPLSRASDSDVTMRLAGEGSFRFVVVEESHMVCGTIIQIFQLYKISQFCYEWRAILPPFRIKQRTSDLRHRLYAVAPQTPRPNVRKWFIRDDAIRFVAHVVDARSAIRTLRCLIRLAG
jgi:hypothetical protein